MPANLPPQYHEVERKFREAKEPAEKLAFLREMFAILPKHKGTDKLQADLKRRISKLQDSLQKSHKAGRRPYAFSVEKEGAAQVVLLGVANSGKSSILKSLTHAEPEVAPYPFTTRKPMPGMMKFEDIQIQLVDMPPVVEEGVEHWFPQLVRGANATLVVVDASSPTLLEDFELVQREMGRNNIDLIGGVPAGAPGAGAPLASGSGESTSKTTGSRVSVPPSSGPKTSGPQASVPPAQIGTGGQKQPGVKAAGSPSLFAQDVLSGETRPVEARMSKRSLVVASKVDVEFERQGVSLLEEYLEGSLKVVPFSAVTGEGIDALRLQIFEMLSLVRVYTKIPGRKPDLDRPFVLPSGSTILDVAGLVHKDFTANLRFARIWGKGVFDGQFVERDHIVRDKDVVELHI